jgi:hypothetical protein
VAAVADAQLRGLLLVAGTGAALALIDLAGTAGAAVGLGLMLLGLVFTAPAAPRSDAPGANWWTLMAVGVAVALIGVPLELASETVGGLLTAVGSGLVVVGVALGLP